MPAVDEALLRALLRRQFPQWAALPLARVAAQGTVNAIFRLGDALAVRIPVVPGDAGVEREATWSPLLAPALPVRVPAVRGVGVAEEGYPGAWLVVDWIEGRTPEPGAFEDWRAIVSFIRALRAIDPAGAPLGHRQGPLRAHDLVVRDALARIVEVDRTALAEQWALAIAAPSADRPVWTHGDLVPSNVLVDASGRLAAVIDMVPGAADPAVELLAAWALIPRAARTSFRDALELDEATWARGRGWAIVQAAVALPYYRVRNETMARMALHTLRELVADR